MGDLLHARLSPSSFPQWEKCPSYESGPVGKAAIQGSYEHEILEKLMKGEPTGDVDEATIDKVQWAYETVLADATRLGVQSDEVSVEERVSIMDENFEEVTFGTGDIAFRDYLYDYKSGMMRNYWGQMAVYALGMMQAKNLDKINVIILYGRFKKMDTYVIERQEAEEYVFSMIKILNSPDKKPKKCDYCKWCVKQTSCPEVVAPLKAVVKVVEHDLAPRRLRDLLNKPLDKMKPSQVAELMPVALAVEGWAEAIRNKCREFLDSEKEVEGWKLQSKRGSVYIKNVGDCMKILEEIDMEDFANCCTVSMPKLVKQFRKDSKDEFKSDVVAKGALIGRIETVLAQKKDSVSMVKVYAKN